MANTRKRIRYVAYLVLSTLSLLVLLEFAVRGLFPQINLQGVERSLFIQKKFGQTMGLVPNASGEFFGKEVRTDQHGFRLMQGPVNHEKSWLFLGDSVTFGAGVDADRIFPQLIQNEFSQIKIWNTAVVGYSTLNYLDVTEHFLRDHADVEKIVLFFCLNDVYENIFIDPGDTSLQERIFPLLRSISKVYQEERIFSFLRSNSKLYMLIKNGLFDRSKTYTLHDIGLYRAEKPNIREQLEANLEAIVRIKAMADKLKLDFLVVILPYEYQLRMNDLRIPQDFLSKYLASQDIKFLDLYDAFNSQRSRDYYLYADAMHLSALGHETVARRMIEVLKRPNLAYRASDG